MPLNLTTNSKFNNTILTACTALVVAFRKLLGASAKFYPMQTVMVVTLAERILGANGDISLERNHELLENLDKERIEIGDRYRERINSYQNITNDTEKEDMINNASIEMQNDHLKVSEKYKNIYSDYELEYDRGHSAGYEKCLRTYGREEKYAGGCSIMSGSFSITLALLIAFVLISCVLGVCIVRNKYRQRINNGRQNNGTEAIRLGNGAGITRRLLRDRWNNGAETRNDQRSTSYESPPPYDALLSRAADSNHAIEIENTHNNQRRGAEIELNPITALALIDTRNAQRLATREPPPPYAAPSFSVLNNDAPVVRNTNNRCGNGNIISGADPISILLGNEIIRNLVASDESLSQHTVSLLSRTESSGRAAEGRGQNNGQHIADGVGLWLGLEQILALTDILRNSSLIENSSSNSNIARNEPPSTFIAPLNWDAESNHTTEEEDTDSIFINLEVRLSRSEIVRNLDFSTEEENTDSMYLNYSEGAELNRYGYSNHETEEEDWIRRNSNSSSNELSCTSVSLLGRDIESNHETEEEDQSSIYYDSYPDIESSRYVIR